ncbi:MAG TPA: bifunctional hydroxymethylpyrimidine kinase/phosphomethylpyrimidine kinase [Candidatus Dormibacteraeota bacterium]|nr:bifunctional hydroxymethylpyrimidine kinase/phosphomethylpyrimidine kinase [Candidatus Dormibacteraeota bacterium]
MKLPVALTIAGSDSGGGAGIQADLKTFAALGVHGTSAITAVTAQNTIGVSDYVELPVEMIRAQIDDVVRDLAPSAAKTGMLASPGIIAVVAAAIEDHGIASLVVDPVMVAKGGAKLLRDDAVDALRTRLIPLAALITPNLPEAEVLLGRPIGSRDERERAARDLVGLGCRAAVVKGGHAGEDADDVVCDGDAVRWLPGSRIDTGNTHGSGCTFSSAITACLARGSQMQDALLEAKLFVTGAIQHSLEIGSGHGPVNPMWQLNRTLPREVGGLPREAGRGGREV